MKIGLIDAKDIDVAQPIWLSGCPMKVHFRAKFPLLRLDSNSRPNDSINDKIIFELKPVLGHFKSVALA